jgi:hypothetical protein
LLVIYAAILVGGRGNPRGVIVGVFVVYVGLIELTRFLPSPASRPDFSPALRQVLIGLMIILMLKFRPEGIFRERPGLDKPSRPARPLTRPFRPRVIAATSGAAEASSGPLTSDQAGGLPARAVADGAPDEGGAG